MKLNNTFVLIDSGGIAKTDHWEKSHAAIRMAIAKMSWPIKGEQLTLPRIVKIEPGKAFTDRSGRQLIWRGREPKTLRNGVSALRKLFRLNLEDSGWRSEEPLSLKAYFERTRADRNLSQIFRYPVTPQAAIGDPLHEGVGDFDFWLRSDTGFRTVVEWETGNISSSHRSLNKMCLALMGGLVDAAVLVVPSVDLYPHLTDRIGNIKELQPYFYFWSRVGQLVQRGLLAVVEVEHEALFDSLDERDFIPRGADGNAFRESGLKIRSRKVRKRAKPGK